MGTNEQQQSKLTKRRIRILAIGIYSSGSSTLSKMQISLGFSIDEVFSTPAADQLNANIDPVYYFKCREKKTK